MEMTVLTLMVVNVDSAVNIMFLAIFGLFLSVISNGNSTWNSTNTTTTTKY